MATEREPGQPVPTRPPAPPPPDRSERSRTRAELAELIATSPGIVRLESLNDGRRGLFWLILAVLLTVTGAAISYELTMRFFNQHTPITGLSAPFCGEAGGACDRVSDSEWGRVELDWQGRRAFIPTALIGLMYFGFLSIWYAFIGRSNYTGRRWHLVPLLIVLAGAAASGWLAYVMYAVMKVVCPLCMAVHVINGLLLIVTLVMWPGRGEVETAPAPVTPMPSGRLVLTGLALAAAVGYGGLLLINARAALGRAGAYEAQAKQFEKILTDLYADAEVMAFVFNRKPKVEIPIDEADAVRGPSDADHTVVIFSDFYCPACAKAAGMLEGEIAALPGVSIRTVYKYAPLDRECNEHVRTTKHPGACEAARIAETVLQQQGDAAFWKFHDAVFAGRKDMNVAKLRALAAEAGVPGDALDEALASDAVKGRVQACIGQLHATGATNRPAIFLDGRRVEGWHQLSTWEAVLGVKAVAPTTQPADIGEESSG